jgi:hypothetical protein
MIVSRKPWRIDVRGFLNGCVAQPLSCGDEILDGVLVVERPGCEPVTLLAVVNVPFWAIEFSSLFSLSELFGPCGDCVYAETRWVEAGNPVKRETSACVVRLASAASTSLKALWTMALRWAAAQRTWDFTRLRSSILVTPIVDNPTCRSQKAVRTVVNLSAVKKWTTLQFIQTDVSSGSKRDKGTGVEM